MENRKMSWGPMLNAYPDSMGGTMGDIVDFLRKPELQHTFASFYILPSMFNTDLDRGFSIINYDLNELMVKKADLEVLEELGIDLKLDFVLNHASVLSEQFQDILKNGRDSQYADFFIDWNKFWESNGTMTEEGYIQPNPELIKDMFFRKPGLPILMVRLPDGTNVPYWNTFYQEVRYPRIDPQDLMDVANMQYCSAEKIATLVNVALDEGQKPSQIDFGLFAAHKAAVVELLESKRRYLGQMDVNIRSPLVWEHYESTLKKLSDYGASIVRLDAFAYAPKEPGSRNFLNDPGTWDLLERVRELADKYGVTLLPEIHASYAEKTYKLVASKGYMVYDFFLPGLIIDALERGTGELLKRWTQELLEEDIKTVNMLGCHDGIPLLDLKGLLPDEQIQLSVGMRNIFSPVQPKGAASFTMTFDNYGCVLTLEEEQGKTAIRISTNGTRFTNLMRKSEDQIQLLLFDGAWVEDNLFIVNARWVETCFVKTLAFRFDGDCVVVSESMNGMAPMGPVKPQDVHAVHA